MRLQTQPNKWSCLPTAFAIATSIPVAEFIEFAGHDGSEILFPDYDEPYCRRSFHPQELTDMCLRENFAVIPIERQPMVLSNDHVHMVPMFERRMDYYLLNYTGVLIGMSQAGTPHAVAWNGHRILDPNGTEYGITNFTIETFFLIAKFNITK
jgi:hypothetical protein